MRTVPLLIVKPGSVTSAVTSDFSNAVGAVCPTGTKIVGGGADVLGGAHSVILSTHILPEVSMVCGGVIIINRGRVVAAGPLDRLMQELSPTARLQVQVEGPTELVTQSLRALPGIQRVEARGVVDGVSTFVLEAERARDIRREVAQLVAQQRWGLLELKALDLSLEDVFIRIVAGEEHEEAMTDDVAASAEEVAS